MLRGILEKIIWGVLFFLVIFSPLPLASNRPAALFWVQAAVFFGALLWVVRGIWVDRALSWCKTRLNVCLFLFFLAACIPLVLRWVPIPPLKGGSFYVKATLEALWRTTAYFSLFWLVLNFLRSEQDISSLIRAVFWVGFGTSFVGVIQKLSHAENVLWFYDVTIDRKPFLEFFSTFVNANHFASFIGMVVLLILGRFLYLHHRYSTQQEKKHREEKIFLLFVLTVSCAGLFMSLSRGGIVIFTLSLLIFSQFILAEKKRVKSNVLIILFVVSTCLMLLWIGLEPILKELSTLLRPSRDLSVAQRLLLWKTSFYHIFLSHPVLGTGLGTFQYVFPGVKPASLFGYWRHVHNDWLEVLLETGAVGACVVLAAVFIFFRETAPIRLNQVDPYIKYNGAGAIAGVTYVLLMSIYDFPLRTTACAVYFSIVAALAVKLKELSDEADGFNRIRRRLVLDSRFKRAAVSLVAAVFFGFAFAGIASPYLAFSLIQKGGKNSIPNLEAAIALDPWDANYHFWLGLARGEEALYGFRKYNDEKMKLAFRSIERAIDLNPGSGKYHYGLAILCEKIGNYSLVDEHFQNTLAKEPHNPFFQIYYSVFCFNQAMVESVLNRKDVTTLPFFQKGLTAYFKAKEILPSISLGPYKEQVASYARLNQIMHKKRLLDANTLL